MPTDRYYAIAPLATARADSYTYRSQLPLKVGAVVEIPYGSREIYGVVLGDDVARIKTKDVKTTTSLSIGRRQIDLARFVSEQYLVPLGLATKLGCWDELMRYAPKAVPVEVIEKPTGRPKIPELLIQSANRWADYRARLEATDRTASQHLVLVPDLAQLERAKAELAVLKPVLFHSRMTPKQRSLIWWRVRLGEPITIVGTRSSLFLPWQHLASVIVDEEDDLSYKAEQAPRYHARAVARQLALINGSTLCYGSAAPSLELYEQARRGTIQPVERDNPAARSRIIDTKKNRRDGLLSFELWQATREALEAKQPVILCAPRKYQPELRAEVKREFGVARGLVKIGGHELPASLECVSLIGFVEVDTLLQLPDFRASEKAQALLRKLCTLLTPQGQLLIQTTTPEDHALATLQQPYKRFAETELQERRQLNLPPFIRLTRIIVTGKTGATARTAAAKVSQRLANERIPRDDMTVSECPVPVIRGKHRWQVLLKGDPRRAGTLSDRAWTVDVDPQSML